MPDRISSLYTFANPPAPTNEVERFPSLGRMSRSVRSWIEDIVSLYRSRTSDIDDKTLLDMMGAVKFVDMI